MNIKAMIATAALFPGFAGLAMAQSNVKIMGELDAGIQYYKATNGTTVKRLQNGAFAASRLIFAGTEDLGGGLAANFNLEMAPQVDTGELSRFGAFNRNSSVSLSSQSLGEIRMGKFLTSTANLVCQVDQFWCGSGFGGSGIMYNGDVSTVGRWVSGTPGRGGNNNDGVSVFSGGTGTAGTADSNRKNNSTQYITPRIGGFQGKLMYALGEAGNFAKNGSGNQLSATVTYSDKNLFVGIGYESVRPDPLWNAKGDLSTIGGTYRFENLTVGAIYQYETASGPAAKWTRASDWAVTAVYQVSVFEPYLKFGQHRTNGIGAYGIKDGIDSQVVNVGTLYRLSKRTALYADIATDMKGSEGKPLIFKAVDPRVMTVGMHHWF
ncbi:porin [Variovorax sp. J2P1-59]|uniref:porin n=1 Tax=Variovorax flavidus TaxID=3053501 RepID=UPI0025783CD4|nr:porin [Variovorax sp. J2P1-59]MDM0075848.1 porin [Variovorax sp. J2P1-59]